MGSLGGERNGHRSPAIDRTLGYARRHGERFVRQLQTFVQIASISSHPQHAPDVERAANWLAQRLSDIGMEHVRAVTTARHPLVVADWLHAPDAPTVLLYGHYDVQPVDPIERWQGSPFSATIREGAIFGRGASDNKGQLFAHVAALEALLKTHGRLPVNIRCVFDGEEEIGSPSLPEYVSANRQQLRSDFGVVSDTRMRGPNQPALTLSLRGSLAMEIELRGPRRELHSGTFGGAVLNPIQGLAEMLTRLHNDRGQIAIPGFYAHVRRYSMCERRALARFAPTDRDVLKEAAIDAGWGETGYTLHERTSIRPALTFHGITGGHQGPGVKSIIPTHATARLSFRLVADQDPPHIECLVRDYLEQITPRGTRLTVRTISRASPASIDRHHPALRVAARAYRAVFGSSPVALRSGGTIPAVSLLQQQLRLPFVLMGFALPNDNIHAANERFQLSQFHRAILTCIRFYEGVSQRGRNRKVSP